MSLFVYDKTSDRIFHQFIFFKKRDSAVHFNFDRLPVQKMALPVWKMALLVQSMAVYEQLTLLGSPWEFIDQKYHQYGRA